MSVAAGTRGWGLDAWMGPGRVDGARDAWMGPGTRGRGRDVRRCRCEAAVSCWSTRGGRVLAVGTDAGGTRDVPVRVVHDEGERQDTRGDTHGGDVRREPQGGRVGVLWAEAGGRTPY